MKVYEKPKSELILPEEYDILTSSLGTDTPLVDEEEESLISDSIS